MLIRRKCGEGVDLITTDPSILTKEPIPENKQFIKNAPRPYNNKIINERDAALQEFTQIADLIDNEKFEKLIGYHRLEL